MTAAPETAQAVFPYSSVIPLDARTVTRFPRKDLEAYARVRLAMDMPSGVGIAPGSRFTYALAENRNAGSRWSHLMRVHAQAVRETR